MLAGAKAARGELESYGSANRPCAQCQVLGECASQMWNDPFSSDVQARRIMLAALGMLGVTDPATLAPELQKQVPSEGGPDLSLVLTRACTGCRTWESGEESSQVGAEPWLQACAQLAEAWRQFHDRRVSVLSDTSDLEWNKLKERNRCGQLEVCQLRYLQTCWPNGAIPKDANNFASTLLAAALDGLSVRDIEAADQALRSAEVAALPGTCLASGSSNREAGTLGQLLRTECRASW
jgi:hypothetical protein